MHAYLSVIKSKQKCIITMFTAFKFGKGILRMRFVVACHASKNQ